MISVPIVVTISLAYFALLFAVAYYADKRKASGASIVSNSTAYVLSLTVYFTGWSFYGTVGRAATVGLDFLAITLGLTLIAFTWWFLLRKMVRVGKEQNITSIADFLSSRYGKSTGLGVLITIFLLLGTLPYIAVQLKAVAYSFDFLTQTTVLSEIKRTVFFVDYAFIVALVLALFSVLFGARHLDVTERHEGLVAVLALESLVKIGASLAAGIFITYGLFDGFGDIFSRFAADFPYRSNLILLGTEQIPYSSWFAITFMSMFVVMLAPRQFHLMVIENTNEQHVKSAMWGFPAYTFLFHLFIVPVALGGLLLTGGDTRNADYFLLSLPLNSGHPWLALFVFLGGFSAAAGMVMVTSITISTMILNHLIMPLILRLKIEAKDISGFLVLIKRLSIFVVILLGYLYFRLIGESYALMNLGLASFIAVAQLAPSFLGALFWRRANRAGAFVGLLLGFALWFYTIVLPIFIRSGWLQSDILQTGLFHLNMLNPLELFGLSGLDIWTHGLFWSLFINTGAFVSLSLFTPPSATEIEQAVKFVDVFSRETPPQQRVRLSKSLTIVEFAELMGKFIGEEQAQDAITDYLNQEGLEIDEKGRLSEYDLPNLKRFAEKTLAGSVGAAPARIIIENYLSARGSHMEDVFDIFGSVTISRRTGREQLGVLHETTRIVASGYELQSIYDRILQLFQQQFSFDLCVIRILDESDHLLKVYNHKGMTSKHFAESARTIDLESYVGATFLNNSVTVVNDTDFMNLDKPALATLIHREGIRSFAHAPISVEGNPIGVLSAFSRSVKGIFTDEFIDLFKNLAGLVGVAWRNAHQAEQLIEVREKEREMEIARSIQLGLLPAQTPSLKGVAMAGLCVPAQEVGGDYYDFLSPFGNQLDLVIADVSGHSVGSALIMGWLRTLVKEWSRREPLIGVATLLADLNTFFYEDLSKAELFVTMFYLRYDADSRELSFANAGHNPPLLWHSKNNTCDWLDAEGMVLGVMDDVIFEEKRIKLEPGDVLLLYTDGITEAEDPDGKFFGPERLYALMSQFHEAAPQQLIDNLLQQVRMFTGRHSFKDDISLVVMRVDGL